MFSCTASSHFLQQPWGDVSGFLLLEIGFRHIVQAGLELQSFLHLQLSVLNLQRRQHPWLTTALSTACLSPFFSFRNQVAEVPEDWVWWYTPKIPTLSKPDRGQRVVARS